MHTNRLFTVIFLYVICETLFAQPANTVLFSFSHKAGNDPLVLDETVFSIWNGKKVRLSRAEFYIAQPILRGPDNNAVQLTDQFMLVNAKTPDPGFNLGQWPVETVSGATLHIGVDADHNHLDPASYPAEHPLAPKNPSMHWGWAAGYFFLAVQGRVDNNNDGVPEAWFEYHTLGDTLFKTLELTGTAIAENDTLHLHFDLDYAKLFQNMSMSGDLIEHSSKGPCAELMSNSATQGFITLASMPVNQTVVTNAQFIGAWPNPAGDHTLIRYQLPVSGTVELIITNTFGQVVYTANDQPALGSVQIETGNWPQGIYYYAFYEKGRLLARKQLAVHH